MVGPARGRSRSNKMGMMFPGTGSKVPGRRDLWPSPTSRILALTITILYTISTATEATDDLIRYQDEEFPPRTVDQCFGQTIPIQCDPGYMVQVNKVFYRQARHCHGSFHSNFCTREEPSNPACVGNETCIFTTPYIYLSPECGYSNNFLVTYKCIPASRPTNICEEGILTAPSGYIVSPRYPAKYPPSQNCKVTIMSEKGSIIQIYLLDLFLAYYNYDVTKQCVDNLWIVGEGEWDRTDYLCSGQQRGLVYRSGSNQATIYFTSKGQEFLSAKGFWLYYEVVEPPIEEKKIFSSTPKISPIPIDHARITPPVKTTKRVSLSPTPTTKAPTTTTVTLTTPSATTTHLPTTKGTTTANVEATAAATTSTSTTATTRKTTMVQTATTPQVRAPSSTAGPNQVVYFRDQQASAEEDIDLSGYLQDSTTKTPPVIKDSIQFNPATTQPAYQTTTTKEHKSLYVEDFNETLAEMNKLLYVENKEDIFNLQEEGNKVEVMKGGVEVEATSMVGEVLSVPGNRGSLEKGLGDLAEEKSAEAGTVSGLTPGNGTKGGNLTVMLEMYNESTDKNRPKLPLWAKETPSQAAVFFRQMDDTTRKGIVGGAGGCLILVLAITVLAILIKRRRSTKNIAPPLQPCIQPKNFDDIILAYGSNDSSKGFVNVGFENESVQDFSIDSTSQSDSSCAWSGTMNSWRGLNPIDEGPEIVYMDAKTAASKKSSGCSKKVKWVKSKSLDDIRHTIRLTQRQLASRSGYIKKKDQDREPFTSMGSLDEDTDGSELSTASTTKLTLAASKQYNTLNDLASCLAQSETTLYSNASTTDSHQITFSGDTNRAESYSPYETVHFQHQEEVAL